MVCFVKDGFHVRFTGQAGVQQDTRISSGIAKDTATDRGWQVLQDDVGFAGFNVANEFCAVIDCNSP